MRKAGKVVRALFGGITGVAFGCVIVAALQNEAGNPNIDFWISLYVWVCIGLFLVGALLTSESPSRLPNAVRGKEDQSEG